MSVCVHTEIYIYATSEAVLDDLESSKANDFKMIGKKKKTMTTRV